MRRLLVVLVLLVAAAAIAAAVRPSLFYVFLPSGHRVVLERTEDNLSVTGSYPEFGRPAVDAYIRALVQESVVEPATADAAAHPHASGAQDRVTVIYAVPYRTPRYASVRMKVTGEGSDHTAEFIIARTYDLWADRVLEPSDISPEEGGIAFLGETIRESLRASGLDEGGARGLQSVPTSFQNFILVDDGIIEFYLSPGQVATPDQGTVVVRIDRESLTND